MLLALCLRANERCSFRERENAQGGEVCPGCRALVAKTQRTQLSQVTPLLLLHMLLLTGGT